MRLETTERPQRNAEHVNAISTMAVKRIFGRMSVRHFRFGRSRLGDGAPTRDAYGRKGL
jgi:hypothetical protein